MARLSPRQWMAVGWTSFFAAGVLEMLVFAVVDPTHQHDGIWIWEWSPSAVYTVAFFVFWSVTAAAGATAQWLLASSEDINQPG